MTKSPKLDSLLSTNTGWHKSSRSGPYSDNCVEVAFLPEGVVAVRDSKNPTGPALIYTQSEWDAFILGAKDGEFNI